METNNDLRINTSIDSTPLIDGEVLDNPFLDLIFANSDINIDRYSIYEQSAMVIGTDSTNWSTICLRPGTIANVKIYKLKGEINNSCTEVKVGSVFDPSRMEIMKQSEISTSGEIYSLPLNKLEEHKNYNNNNDPSKIKPIGIFTIISKDTGLTIEYNHDSVFKDSSIFTSENGPEYTNSERFPFIAFINCFIEITVTEYNDIRSKYHHKIQTSQQ